jgi:glucose/arabinose dehydrogenase
MTAAAAPRKTLRKRLAVFAALGLLAGGCINQPTMLPASKQKVIDRKLVEYPSGFVLVPLVNGLNYPTAEAFDDDGNLLVAESGFPEPHIFGFHKDGTYFNIYPWKRNISFYPTGKVLYGPIGGMVCRNGKIYVSHKDRDGMGVITALGYDGSQTTIIAGLPARGDYGVTDLVFSPIDDRLWFGVGTATNSGVVGQDNWDEGSLKRYPDLHDEIYSPTGTDYKLNGYRFDSQNPRAGLFGGADIARTRPFQPFGANGEERVHPSEKPNGAIYSVNADGGEARVEVFGIHNPRGLAYSGASRLYFTNDGMQLRGTRPIKNDPDALLGFGPRVWYGWPDSTTDLRPVTDPYFQPPIELLIHGYTENSDLIDHDASGLHAPDPSLVAGVFPTMSGASKLVFAPNSGPFAEFYHSAIVALDGDQAPFATSGVKNFQGPMGSKVVRVDLDARQVKDFIVNTAGVPASLQGVDVMALERPTDVKIGPDGALYILDMGRLENKTGIPRIFPNSGRIFKLMPAPQAAAATSAATTQESPPAP